MINYSNPENFAKGITEKIASESYKLFVDKTFRKLIQFDKLEQEERDRIFNEIVATGISLAVLMFESLAKMSSGGISQFYLELKMEMTSRYGNWLAELGTPGELAKMWKELITLRTDEYRADYAKHKKEIGDIYETNPWTYITAIGGFHHITRGKGKPDDKLFKIIIRWINKLSKEIYSFMS